MAVIVSDIGVFTFVVLVLAFLISARTFALGAMSLPCMTVMTSMIYFFAMPAISFAGGNVEFFGMYMTSMEWPHFAVLLYSLGAMAAFAANRKDLQFNPASTLPFERKYHPTVYYTLVFAAVIGLAVHISLGRLNLTAADDYEFAKSVGDLAFINLFFTMMIPLTIIHLIRENFNVRSLIVLAVVSFILLQTGFRYRLIFMTYAVAASFLLVRGTKIRVSYVVVGTLVGVLGNNAMVTSRKYGQGVDISKLDGMGWLDILQSFGGEVGPLYSFTYTASNPLPDLAYFTPWTVAIARLVPSFIWPDKPTADYLAHYFGGFVSPGVEKAGIAAPQQVEMLLQFGWFGLPFLAFLYFSIAAFLLHRISKLGREARITGYALAPVFFGFYMQTRGYFFQTLSDGLFTFGPLFLIHMLDGSPSKRQLSYGRPQPAMRQRPIPKPRGVRAPGNSGTASRPR
jgi:hypothetical protein